MDVFFFEEVTNDPRLILAAPEVCSGVRHHVRLVAGSLPPHGLLGVLVEQLVWVEFWAVAGHEAELQFRLPLLLGCDPAGYLCGLVGGMGVDDEDDLLAVGGSQETGEEADEDIAVEAAREHHEPEAS